MEDKNDSPKIFFSEEIDSKITGFSLILTFLSLGIFLLIFPYYFGNAIASEVVRWIFISIGILGSISEFSKSKNTAIKGLDDFILGCFFIAIWVVLFLLVHIWWVNVICFFILLIGAFGLYQGTIKIVYSTFLIIRNKQEGKREISTDIILLSTKFASLMLVIIQIAKVFGNK